MTSLPLYVLKSHESFTYVSPNVFSASRKLRFVNVLQEIVQVSFSAPNASQQCGAFLFVCRLVCPLPIVHVSLVQEIISRTMFPCTSLADLADYPPDPGILEQKIPSRDVFWCTSETCTSIRRLRRSCSQRKIRVSLSGNKNRHFCSQRETRARRRVRFRGFLFPTRHSTDLKMACLSPSQKAFRSPILGNHPHSPRKRAHSPIIIVIQEARV